MLFADAKHLILFAPMKTHLNTLLIAAAVVIAALTLGNALRNRNAHQHSIAVTGLGSKDFTSDLIVWRASFVAKNMELKAAYSELEENRNRLRKYLLGKGIQESNMIFSAVEINKEYDETYGPAGNRLSSRFSGYALRQSVQVESKAVDLVDGISREATELINSGVELTSEAPQYYYTKLAALKLEMIGTATRDARERAERIAQQANASLGNLKKADMGVFQIVAQNSSEDFSWGGSFNTTSKKKTATITVKLEYVVGH
jgi:hypothetical protein